MGGIDDTLNALMDNITDIVKDESTKLANEEANKFTGSNIPGIKYCFKTAKVADEQVEIELLKHISAQDEEGPGGQKDYYKLLIIVKKTHY